MAEVVTLDTGVLIALESDLIPGRMHPLRSHYLYWKRKDVSTTAPATAWAEFWRGRGRNEKSIADLKPLVSIDPVDRDLAARAAEAVRVVYGHDDAPAIHLLDAIVMAHADRWQAVVYTADVQDLSRLFAHFPNVRAIVSSDGTTAERR